MKKWILTWALAAMLAITPTTAFATEQTTTVSIEEVTPATVDDMIHDIDIEHPKEEEVKAAREAYESLTQAQKVQVKNFTLLREAEQAIAERSGANPDSDKKRGTKYSFRISEYVQKVTLSVSYMTDADSDGIMDEPNLTFLSPTGATIPVPKDQDVIQSSWYEFAIRRTPSGTTIDVLKAENGTWTIEADNEVIYQLSDYAEQPSYEELTVTKEPQVTTAPEVVTEPGDEEPTPWFALILCIVCLVTVVVLLVMIFKPAGPKAPKKPKKGEPDEIPGEEKNENQKFQEELDYLMTTFAKSREEEAARNNAAKVVEEDSRLFESVLAEDLPEDDGITPLGQENKGGKME